MSHPRFPLPEGHCYASARHDRCHRGDSDVEGIWLAAAQRRLRVAWKAQDVEPSGMYDGCTMEAVGAVQRAYSMPVTGWLDADTWEALWLGPPSPEPELV